MASAASFPGRYDRASALPYPWISVGEALHRLGRRRIEDIIEAMIAWLDQADGNVEAEDGDEDCCAGRDDHVVIPATHRFGQNDGRPGDSDDAEVPAGVGRPGRSCMREFNR